MFLSKTIFPVNLFVARLTKLNQFSIVQTDSLNKSQLNELDKVPELQFGLMRNIQSEQSQFHHRNSIENLKQEIESITEKLDQNEGMKHLDKIVYPQALLHCEESLYKLTRLYDVMIKHLEEHNLEDKHFQQLIKAGDFYSGIRSRRLRALKPYLKAKDKLESLSLHTEDSHRQTYNQICQHIDYLVKQDIQNGEHQKSQHYYTQGLQQENIGNQLQALYCYYKGIHISEYEGIPDKLTHYDMLARYTFLSHLMKPKPHGRHTLEFFKEGLEKYEQVERLGRKWWKEQFQTSQDQTQKRNFELIEAWVLSNKGNLYFSSRQYEHAAQCYEEVIQIYKRPKHLSDRIKIVKVIENLTKSYRDLGKSSKALNFLQWAHEFVKQQAGKSALLKLKYLKPVDQLLVSFYQHSHHSENRLHQIQNELKQLVR